MRLLRTFLVAVVQERARKGDFAGVLPTREEQMYTYSRFYGDRWLRYRDEFCVLNPYVTQGTVLVYDACEDSGIWCMEYEDECIEDALTTSRQTMSAVKTFRNEALAQVQPLRPYRGPTEYTRNSLTYRNQVFGHLPRFEGIEEVYQDGTLLCRFSYTGGILRTQTTRH